MNILLAGVHGVGKTYLASRLPAVLRLLHTSASSLIKEERTLNWGVDKRVSDLDANQIALTAAVRRYNDAGTRLLLDGHFVLLNSEGAFSRLEIDVFKSLNLDGVVLLEAAPDTVVTRIRKRDGQDVDLAHLVEFIADERSQAQIVCRELGIPLYVLTEPTLETFAEAVSAITSKR